MTYDFKTNGLVKYAIKKGGSIKPLIVDSSLTGGTGLMNPSVFVDEDKSIYCIIRNTNYILNHSEHSIYHQKFQSWISPTLWNVPHKSQAINITIIVRHMYSFVIEPKKCAGVYLVRFIFNCI